jgi:hypothetical protein
MLLLLATLVSAGCVSQAAAIGLSPEDAQMSFHFMLNLVLGGLLALFIRGLYKRYGTTVANRDEFSNMFPVFTLATIVVIYVVKSSLALSLGIIGALTIVRFRGPIKSPEELVYLLFCVSMGLALGADQPLLAFVAASIIALFIVFRGIASQPAYERNLLLTVAGDARRFFPEQGGSGLEQLRKFKPVTLQRLDHQGDRVEVRVIMTIERGEKTEDVLTKLREDLAHFRVIAVDVDDVHRGRGRSTNPQPSGLSPAISEGKFEIIDVPSPPDVDSFRREVKFALPNADSHKVRSVLEVNCQRICHRGPSSLVSTIYYDDARLSACHDNLDGNPRRAKVRLRWYDDDDQEGHLFFEIKRRVDSMIHKERLAIRSSVPLARMTYPEILAELKRILPTAAREMLLHRPEAMLLSQYRREYFRAPGRLARITLDEEIVSYSQKGLTRPCKQFGAAGPELVILEAKIPGAGGVELRELLHPLEPYVTKSSKYVMGCLRLGLLDGTAGTNA